MKRKTPAGPGLHKNLWGQGTAEKTNNSTVIAFPRRYFTPCRACGAPFSPFMPKHRICSDCYHWHKELAGIETTRHAFKEVLS